MENSFEMNGFWWLLETPTHKAPGTLKFSPGEFIQLELMGSLEPIKIQDFAPLEFSTPALILGESVDGKPITLHKCLQKHKGLNQTGIYRDSFIAHYAFVGVHFASAEEMKFKGLSIGFQNLDEWFSQMAFKVKREEDGLETVTYRKPDPVKTMVGDWHIDFACQGPNLYSDRVTHIKISQAARINVWSEEEQHIYEFLPVLRGLRNFLTLAITRPTFLTKVIGNTEAAKDSTDEKTEHYASVEIYFPEVGERNQILRTQWFEMLFTLPHVSAQLEMMLRNWFAKRQTIQPVYDLYFSTLYLPVYAEFHFLSLAQAVETYHRRVYGGKYLPDEEFLAGPYKALVAAIPGELARDFKTSLKKGKLRYANEYSLNKRMQLLGKHLANKLDISFLKETKQRNYLAEKVANTRNYLTHYTPELKDKAATGGEELDELTRRLRLMLQVCLLEELGFPFEKIGEIFKKSREYRQYFG